ncbi:secretion system protein E [Methanofollis aquaemaris]|uniref:Secretion system protein E n=1 Tax=Methanofollis aquaemaris TaxID=126734 RepID=A0A8A3S4B9_9EURY|nr:type II/IV secretion system ATPase subunit [Methanofollis aquaemaris]QSZ66763.1 secretion system protein E [Methanofollis aquaemaris]
MSEKQRPYRGLHDILERMKGSENKKEKQRDPPKTEKKDETSGLRSLIGKKDGLDLSALVRDPRNYGLGEEKPAAPPGTEEPADTPIAETPHHEPQDEEFDDQAIRELKSAVDAILSAREDEAPAPTLSMEEETPLEEEAVSPAPEAVPVSRKSRWSSEVGNPEEEPGADITDVDDLSVYSDLILPKAATFDIEEFTLQRPNHRETLGVNNLPPEIDVLWADTVPTIAEEARNVVIGREKGEKSGFLGKIGGIGKIGAFDRTQHKSSVEEYDPAVHGPLVDLTFTPPAGVEEVELYPVNEPFAYVRISYDSTSHEYSYEVLEPALTAAENELFGEIKDRLFERLDVSTKDLSREGARQILRDLSDEIVADYGIHLSSLSREKIYYTIERDFLGNGLIDAIMHDKYIEDISCDGLDNPVFVFHSGYESIKTNLMYTNAVELDSFVTKLAQRAGKYISIADPILDATMSDGSRIQMTLGKEVTAHGSTFTIRKFKDEPITPTDLIGWGTFSPLSVAFLWLAVEAGNSAIFAGGTASGKTTALNAISLFIPPQAKIVSLEDTRELKLPHANWIPSVTRESFDTEGKGTIDMYELLRAALRQRPEYMCVGEVRGAEAQTLFQAMSTGHVTYATMHADSVASVVHRLENPPLDVPRNMLNALNLVCIQAQARIGGQRIRRNKQIIEILDIDPRTNELITNEVFSWHQATDEIRYSGKSYILETIMETKGWSEARMREELKRRQEMLEWMRVKNIRHYKDVSKMLISYFRDADAVIGLVREELYREADQQ